MAKPDVLIVDGHAFSWQRLCQLRDFFGIPSGTFGLLPRVGVALAGQVRCPGFTGADHVASLNSTGPT